MLVASRLSCISLVLVTILKGTASYSFSRTTGGKGTFSKNLIQQKQNGLTRFASSKPKTTNIKLSMSSANPANFNEITSALALIDSQRQKNSKDKSSWQKIFIPKENQDDESTSESPNPSPSSTQEFIYYLPPKSSSPKSAILFLGGAGLGQYPHITYDNLLTRLSQKSDSAIIAAPYSVNLDHFELAKKSGDLLRRAVIMLEDGKLDPNLTMTDEMNIPKYALCHSLGAKLQCIFMAATSSHLDLKGIGMMAYNNFGLAASIQMSQSFLSDSQNGSSKSSPQNPMWDNIFQFAEQAVSTIGIDFTPSPTQMDQLLSLKFDQDMKEKTRLFVFEQDDLDSSPSFLEATESNSADGTGLEISNLDGSHLTPVYLQFKLSDLEVEEEIKNVVGQFSNEIQQISWGDEGHLNALVEELDNWMKGLPPSEKSTGFNNQPRLLGIMDAEIE